MTYANGKETNQVKPSIYDLPLFGGLVGLRVLDDPSWRERWEEALRLPVDEIPPGSLGLSADAAPIPLAKRFATELLARNEATPPELAAEWRRRYLLG